MTRTDIREAVEQNMLLILQENQEIQRFILRLARGEFADKGLTESRFDRILQEMRQDREEQRQKWEEQNQKWEEQNQKWEEQNQKWEENQQVIRNLLQEVKALSRKHDSTIGALGARWGLHTEASFRNALKGILQESFQVEVLNITEFDETGEVFGRPEQVELDVIIQNGLVIACEIKSSISRGEVYIFDRKVAFYEKLHQRTVNRKMIISPMVEDQARRVADTLGIEVYSHAEDAEL